MYVHVLNQLFEQYGSQPRLSQVDDQTSLDTACPRQVRLPGSLRSPLSLCLSIFSLSIVCPLLPIRPSSPLLFFFSPSSPPLAGSREALCIWILNFNCAFQVQPPPFCFPRPPLRLPSPWLLFPPRLFPFQSSSFLLRLFRDKDTGATDNAMSSAASEKRVYENRIG